MKTIGQYLDHPNEFFWWLNRTLGSVIVLNTAVSSGFLSRLDEGPATVEQLSERSRIPVDKLGRLVGYLVAEEVVAALPDGRLAHTARSRSLPALKAALACFGIYSEAGADLSSALAKGVTAYEHRFGKPVFEHLGDNPETAAVFADFMAYMTVLVEDFVFTQHVFKPFDVAVDVGGSHGGLLLKLLARHPAARGVLFDLPEVAAMVTDQVRGSEHGDRVEIVGGDFFESVPAGDLYLLKMILHDWNDEECIVILRSIRKAIASGGRVAVIDHLMPETPRPHPAYAMDLAMLVWATGRERKLSELSAFFAASGFKLDRVSENPLGWSVVEAVAG